MIWSSGVVSVRSVGGVLRWGFSGRGGLKELLRFLLNFSGRVNWCELSSAHRASLDIFIWNPAG